MRKITFIILFSIIFNQISFSQNQAIKSFGDTKGVVYDICFSKDSNLLIMTEGSDISVYNFKTQQLLYKLSGGHKRDILSIDISPDDSRLISGGQDGLVILWNLENHSLIKKLDYHNGVVTTVKFSPNIKEIISGGSDNKVIFYNLDLEKVSFTFSKHKKDVSSVAFNSTGDILASAGEDKMIYFINTSNGELVGKIDGHKSYVRQIKFGNNDTRFISCDDGSELMIWKTENLNNIKNLQEKNLFIDWLLSVDIYRDNQAFVTGGISGKVKVVTYFGTDTFNVNSPIHKVLFIPSHDAILRIAVATRGKGVLLIDTSK